MVKRVLSRNQVIIKFSMTYFSNW